VSIPPPGPLPAFVIHPKVKAAALVAAVFIPLPIGNGEQSQIIALTQKRVRRCHVTGRNNRATPDCHQIDHDQHDKKDRQQNQRNHYGAGFEQRLEDGRL